MRRVSFGINRLGRRSLHCHLAVLIGALSLVVGCSTAGVGSEVDEDLLEVTAAAPIQIPLQSTPIEAHTATADATTPTLAVTPSRPSDLPPPSPTPVQTSTEQPQPKNTATATRKPSPTIAASCRDRIPSDELLTLVTSEYSISANYRPEDLAFLSDYLPAQITRGYPTQLRQVAIPSLVEMIGDMLKAGLQPEIVSGYRSYSTQAIAWSKWQNRLPDRASIISVPPGQSEHQLGTTVDFGSPELEDLVGDENSDFHTYFYRTGEGSWIEEHAHEYGYTLSYPLEAFDITGFYYEPWHYRYIGVELSSQLKVDGITLTQYLLDTMPLPCEP